jgi:ribosomal protein S18 acetylase RimI-like enzyme
LDNAAPRHLVESLDVDLQVMSQNHAALALYRRAGFATVGELDDMFNIDGLAFSSTTMSMRLICGSY